MRKTTLERFQEKYVCEPNTGCWLWVAGMDAHGYGKFRWNGDNERKAHRYSYQTFVGPIPDGLVPDHLCRVRSCVNPQHLELVTERENILRGIGPAAQNARKSTCSMGHPLEGDNLRVLQQGDRKGKRRCWTCLVLAGRRYYAANPELRRRQALESYYRRKDVCRSTPSAQ